MASIQCADLFTRLIDVMTWRSSVTCGDIDAHRLC